MVCTKFQRLLQIGWRCVFYLIRKNQTAFIQGRRIAENMLLAQENVTYYTIGMQHVCCMGKMGLCFVKLHAFSFGSAF